MANQMSKRQAAETLTKLKDAFTSRKDQPFITAIDVALADLASCPWCSGTGNECSRTAKPGDKARKTPRGTHYVRPCPKCDGTGKYFEGRCCSCGHPYKVEPRQTAPDMCASCEDLQIKKGNLLR
jgi:DnaJ-class molecular chaperone